MATKAVTYPADAGPIDNDTIYVAWLGMQNGDVGAPVKVAEYEQPSSLHVLGTLGVGGSIILRGSNKPNPDPAVAADWVALKDAFNVAIAATAFPAMVEMTVNPMWISPICAGDGTTLADTYFLTKKTS